MEYLETINHKNFRRANTLVHTAEDLLQDMGLTLEEARGWIGAWASSAGDGAQ